VVGSSCTAEHAVVDCMELPEGVHQQAAVQCGGTECMAAGSACCGRPAACRCSSRYETQGPDGAASCCSECQLLLWLLYCGSLVPTEHVCPPYRHGKKSVKCKESPRPTITDPVRCSGQPRSLQQPQLAMPCLRVCGRMQSMFPATIPYLLLCSTRLYVSVWPPHP
jgi:hypothetical protein